MSFRNLNDPQNKSWLNANFNNLNAKTLDFNATQKISTVSGSIISLQGDAGSIGDVIRKDVSNIPAWSANSQVFGSVVDSFLEHEVTPFTTSSLTYVDVSTFTTISLSAGQYVLHYSIEGENTTGEVSIIVEHITGGPFTSNEWLIDGSIIGYHACTGFQEYTLSGINVFKFSSKIVTPATLNSLRRARFQLYRAS